jgi:hypothetical protein
MEMPMWIWIVIGIGSFVGLSLLIGFAFAQILGTIGREISELYETETWAALPPTRAASGKDQDPAEVEAKSSRVDADVSPGVPGSSQSVGSSSAR